MGYVVTSWSDTQPATKASSLLTTASNNDNADSDLLPVVLTFKWVGETVVSFGSVSHRGPSSLGRALARSATNTDPGVQIDLMAP